MKLQDLFEEQRVIEGNIEEPVEITELDYKGVIVKGNFRCPYTRITSLKGAPSYVGGSFYCHATKITSLEGAPSYVGKDFHCDRTGITSLHNIHKQIHHIGRILFISNTIKSNIIGVMLIKGFKKIGFDQGDPKQNQAVHIINTHLYGDRDIHACQEELLEAGLGAYAKL